MALTLERDHEKIRRVSLISTGVLALVALVAIPVYTSTAVHSPRQTVADKKASDKTVVASKAKKQSQKKKAAAVKSKKAAATAVTPASCTTADPIHPGLAGATSPQLKKLSQYEAVCGSGVFSKLSFFVGTPTNNTEAVQNADYVANRLLEFSRYGMQPVVFFEPTSSAGLVDMKKYRGGSYDTSIDTFFAALKSAGVTDATMGTWVPIPEGNIPVWTSLAPGDYAATVTKAVKFQKKHFPRSKASLLLDNLTYPRSNDWSGGRAVSLLPYLKGIPRGTIDSFGLQGFPWVSPANQGMIGNGSASDYLKAPLAAEAATYLGIRDVWFNTGTFSKKYAGKAGQEVVYSPSKRISLLHGAIAQAKTLKSQGMNVSIHLFAEDKSGVAEATDWSYWKNGNPNASSSTVVFKRFAGDARRAGLSLWLFDK